VSDTQTTQTPEQRIAQLVEELRLKNLESEAKDAVIESQEEKLAAARAQGLGSLSVITHKKKRYQVLAGQFSLEGKTITHDQLATDAELAKLVVEKYPGLVLELADEKAA
jgi:hypothetical protein